MNSPRFIGFVLLLLCPILAVAQPAVESSRIDYYRLLELNVENLFDTAHDVGKDDLEFTIRGARRWTPSRYRRKLQRISKIIAAAGDKQPIELIALCEVENDSVLTHLTKRYPLRPIGYEYVMTHSEDQRGIDVALVYHPMRFQHLGHRSIRVLPLPQQRPTRDVLHAWGIVPTGDTLHIFVAHLPSKRGGAIETEPYRIAIAERIRQVTDSLLAFNPQTKIIVTGDFNDIPTSATLRQGLQVEVADSSSQLKASSLYLLSKDLHVEPGIRGTYKFQGRWEQIDHVVVSGGLLKSQNGLYTCITGCQILALPFMLKPDLSDGGVAPFRSFLGPRYVDGFTDHLPLLLTMQLHWNE